MKPWILVVLAALGASRASAQTATPPPAAPFQPLPDMQLVAQALGVKCEFCHNRDAASTSPKSKKLIAREMMEMTREVNARIEGATGKPASDLTRVECITCHRGVSIPKQLTDIITRTAIDQGPDAAVAQYRELRERYFGQQSYDFSELGLIRIGERLSTAKPDASIALLQLNLEYHPQSVNTYLVLAYAYTRKRDNTAAMATLAKVLELDPENMLAKGRMYQLEHYRQKH